MSAIQILIEGALRAASLLPLALTLGLAEPAQARIVPGAPPAPEAVPGAVRVLLDAGEPTGALTLVDHHVDVRIVNGRALAITSHVYRNDGALPVDAQYGLPAPSTVATADEESLLAGDIPDDPFASAGAADDTPRFPGVDDHLARGVMRVAPGAELTVISRRPVGVLVRGNRYRLVLPLAPVGRAGAESFSADVTVVAPVRIVALASATHPVETAGLGTPCAQLSSLGGGDDRFFAVEFQLDAAVSAAPSALAAAPR